MVKLLAHNATNTGVQILGVALVCFGLGAVAWAADYRVLAISIFVAGAAFIVLDAAGAVSGFREWLAKRRNAREQAEARLRYENQIRTIDARNSEQRRAQKEEHDRVLRELQEDKANAIARARLNARRL